LVHLYGGRDVAKILVNVWNLWVIPCRGSSGQGRDRAGTGQGQDRDRTGTGQEQEGGRREGGAGRREEGGEGRGLGFMV